MTTQEMADKYYDMYQQGRAGEIQDTLYHHDVICTEPEHAESMGIPHVTKTLDGIKAKSKARMALISEVHGSFCSKPVVGGKYFSVSMSRDISFKAGGRRNFEEIAVFGVENDKIVSETFFY